MRTITKEDEVELLILLALRDAKHRATKAAQLPDIAKKTKDAVMRCFASQATATLQPIPMVNGLDCPACGHPTLILGNGGYITCSLEGCPNPDYAEAATAAQEGAVLEARINELELAIMHVGKQIKKKDLDSMLNRLNRLKGGSNV